MTTEQHRPRLLDLFCGAGGAAMGYHRAGFDVVGVDIAPQPRFPFEFVRADALEYLKEHGHEFDVIHASPPCQAHSVLRRANIGKVYESLIEPTRDALQNLDAPWVIENVPGAPLRDPLTLCGSMFGLGALSGNGVNILRHYRQLRRHRLFESSVVLAQLKCAHVGEAIGVYGGGPVGRYTFENGAKKDRYGRRGGYQGTVAERREAMGIDWMPTGRLNQAIPPAYTEYIGLQLMEAIECPRHPGWLVAPECDLCMERHEEWQAAL